MDSIGNADMQFIMEEKEISHIINSTSVGFCKTDDNVINTEANETI